MPANPASSALAQAVAHANDVNTTTSRVARAQRLDLDMTAFSHLNKRYLTAIVFRCDSPTSA